MAQVQLNLANTESWASTAINQAYMVQGWVFYMNYSRFFVQRQIEAYAIYSDTNTAESARKVSVGMETLTQLLLVLE